MLLGCTKEAELVSYCRDLDGTDRPKRLGTLNDELARPREPEHEVLKVSFQCNPVACGDCVRRTCVTHGC